MFHGLSMLQQAKSLEFAQERLVRYYWWRLLHDGRDFLHNAHGNKWHELDRSTLGVNFNLNLEAICDIMWRSTEDGWLEYLMGSRLKFLWYPVRYRMMVKDGVPIFFTGPYPSP